MSKFKIGDRVVPVSGALELADVPVNGKYQQHRNVTCIFRGTGTVFDIEHVIIDYDSWATADKLYENIGQLEYEDYLIFCDDGVGWAGMGAITNET
jgi:hypothetical protein